MTQLSDAEIAELEAARLATLGLYYSRNAMERYLELLLDAGPALIAAAKAQRDDGWRTMESAPKDGTRILVYCSGEQYVSEWIGDIWNTWAVRTRDGLGEWRSFDGIGRREWPEGRVIAQGPTRWRPLPAPPSPQEKPE